MNLRLFFQVAGPTTLASLIADVHMLGKGASADEMRLACLAQTELEANVGKEESGQLIDAMMGSATEAPYGTRG